LGRDLNLRTSQFPAGLFQRSLVAPGNYEIAAILR